MESLPNRRKILEFPGDRKNLAKSATRALDVLEFMAQVRHSVRAIEVAHALHLHTSSTDQLLKTLVDSGYLIFDRDQKHYSPSPRLIRFGTWLEDRYYGADNLSRLLSILSMRSGELVTLAVRQGHAMQIVDVIEAPSWPSVIQKGLRASMLRSALGVAYLAARPPDELPGLIDQLAFELKEPASIVDGVRRWIERVRADGYAIGGLASDNSAASLTMALPKPQSGHILVLGLSGAEQRMRTRKEDLVAMMRRSIAETLII
jgi:DNA-binding IclR family transcriptional regulator